MRFLTNGIYERCIQETLWHLAGVVQAAGQISNDAPRLRTNLRRCPTLLGGGYGQRVDRTVMIQLGSFVICFGRTGDRRIPSGENL